LNYINCKRLMADIRLKKVTVEPNGSPLIIQYGDLKISNSTVSSSAIDGALLIEGGIGIKTSFDATSCTSGGGLTIGGGAAILKTLQIGGDSVLDSSIGIFRVKGITQDRITIDSVVNKQMLFAPDGVNIRMGLYDTNLTLNFTRPSLNATTGGLSLLGGMSISATENSASATQGGGLTISGGAAVNKKLCVGEGISASGNNTLGNIFTVNDFVGIGAVNPLSRVSITPNTTEPKITLWDAGSTTGHFGFGVSDNQLNYHVFQSQDRHVFYGGGRNGDGIELMAIQGNGLIGINTSSPSHRLDVNGTFRVQSDGLLVSNSNTVGNIITTGGNVGIGTASPFSRLHVNGNYSNYLNSSTGYLELSQGWERNAGFVSFHQPDGTRKGYVGYGTTSQSFLLWGEGSRNIVIGTNSTDRMIVTSAGNVGIGTSNPEYALDVVGTARISNSITTGGLEVTGSGIVDTPNLTTANITSATLILSTGLTSANAQITNVCCSSLIASVGITTATILASSSFIGLSNSNTIGSIITTGGNSGFNTVTPLSTVDINGTLMCNDNVTFSKTLASTNSSTGAFVVSNGGISINTTENASSITTGGSITSRGGMSIAKDVYLGGNTNMASAVNISGGVAILTTQNALSSVSGGALTIAGGTSIKRDLYVGGNIIGTGTSSSTFAYLTITATDQSINLSSGSIISAGGITIQSSANATSITNGGSLLAQGGGSFRNDVYIGGKNVVYGSSEYIVSSNEVIKIFNNGGAKRFSFNFDTSSNDFSLGRYNPSSAFVENVLLISSSTGSLTFSNSGASTSNEIASIIMRGGLSIQNSQDASNITNGGSITIAGGASIRRKLFVGGDVQILSSTASSNVSTGALLVTGGVGVSGALNVLGNTVLNGNLTVRGTTMSVESTNTVLKDNLIVLNSGPSGSKDSGFIIQRFQQDNNFGLGDVVNDTRYTEINLPSQFGILSNQLKLSSGASSADNFYTGWWIKIASGFSSNQVRKIISYTGSTRLATLSTSFDTQNPSENDNVYLYNKSYVGLIYSELDDQFVLGSSVENPGTSAVAFSDTISIKLDSGVFMSTQPSSSVSVGSIMTNGGITIANTTDALSLTNGGSLLTLGGAAVGKTLLVGQGMSTNNIYITGDIYQNGILFTNPAGSGIVSSQWIDGISGDLYYPSNVGIGTSSPSAKLHVIGGAIVSGDVTIGTLVCNNSSFGNLSAQALGTRMGNIFSNAFNAANNVASASNVIGFSFSNASIRSFSANVTVSVIKSSGGNLYETFTLEGHQTDAGWTLLPSSFGDVSGITFSITSSGQVQYTSINHSNWTSTVIRFMVSQMYTNGDMTAFSGITSGSIIADSVQISSTSEYIAGVNNGAFNVKGGSVFEKGIAIQATANSSGIGTGGSLTVLGGASISKDLYIGEEVFVSGNVGIGTSSPGYTIDVVGTARVTSSILTTNITAVGNSNTIGSIITTFGNVGINTISPLKRLHVNGDYSNYINSTTGYLELSQGWQENSGFVSFYQSNGTRKGFIGYGSTSQSFLLWGEGSRNIVIGTNAIERMIVTSAGNVGVGTSNPEYTLDVTGTARFTTGITAASAQINNATIGTARVTTNLLALGNSNTIGSIFTTGGNVGINTTAPQFNLHVNGSTFISGGITTGNINFTGNLFQNGQTYISSQWLSGTGGSLSYTNGNVGIATTAPQFNLHVVGSSFISDGITTGNINFTGSLFQNGQPYLGSQWLSGTGGNLSYTNGNVGIGTTAPSYALQVAGDVYATGDVISFSDERLKTNIQTIENAVEKIEKLRGVYYTHIQTQKRGLGLIAQEAQEVIPELVIDKGKEEYLGVAYGNVVGILIEGIKELSESLKQLRSDFENLKMDKN
jgi:fibronectin-binding autotransporter adhesin